MLGLLFSLLQHASLATAVASAGFEGEDWVTWDDTTWTLKSTRPTPGIFTSWSPQSNGYDQIATLPVDQVVDTILV